MPVVNSSSPPCRYGVGSVSSLTWTPLTSTSGMGRRVTGSRSGPSPLHSAASVGKAHPPMLCSMSTTFTVSSKPYEVLGSPKDLPSMVSPDTPGAPRKDVMTALDTSPISPTSSSPDQPEQCRKLVTDLPGP